MDTNTTSNNVWTCKFCKQPLSNKYSYQSHMDRDVKLAKTIYNEIVLMMNLNSS